MLLFITTLINKFLKTLIVRLSLIKEINTFSTEMSGKAIKLHLLSGIQKMNHLMKWYLMELNKAREILSWGDYLMKLTGCLLSTEKDLPLGKSLFLFQIQKVQIAGNFKILTISFYIITINGKISSILNPLQREHQKELLLSKIHQNISVNLVH